MQHVNLLLGEPVKHSKFSFVSYFYESYCDIGVPFKLLPPCQEGGLCKFTCIFPVVYFVVSACNTCQLTLCTISFQKINSFLYLFASVKMLHQSMSVYVENKKFSKKKKKKKMALGVGLRGTGQV